MPCTGMMTAGGNTIAIVANSNTPPPAPKLAVMAEVRQEKKIKKTVVAWEMDSGHSQSNMRQSFM